MVGDTLEAVRSWNNSTYGVYDCTNDRTKVYGAAVATAG
jgi:hypothetical protein